MLFLDVPRLLMKFVVEFFSSMAMLSIEAGSSQYLHVKNASIYIIFLLLKAKCRLVTDLVKLLENSWC